MFICQPLVIMISNTISESQQQMKSSPQHRTQMAFPQPWALPATRVHAPLILLLMLFFSTLSPLSPPPSSAASRAKNSSKFSPSTLAKPKLLNFNVPGPSNSICERSEKKPFQKQTELKHSSVLFTFNYLIRRGGEKQRDRDASISYSLNLSQDCTGPRARKTRRVPSVYALGPSSAVFQDALAGSWIRSRAPRTQISTAGIPRSGLNPVYCSAGPFP